MSKHTPGPWIATGTTVSEQASYGTGNRVVAECGQSTNGETDLANARLIAAAPELLEILKTICRANEFSLAMRVQAEKAIAKAEGEKK